jgi:hypothetical protein
MHARFLTPIAAAALVCACASDAPKPSGPDSLAGTRALCPPPSLDSKLLADLGYVRGHLFRDGMLHMSLMADAGIYSWRQAPR